MSREVYPFSADELSELEASLDSLEAGQLIPAIRMAKGKGFTKLWHTLTLSSDGEEMDTLFVDKMIEQKQQEING